MLVCMFEKQNFKVWQVDEKPDKSEVEEELEQLKPRLTLVNSAAYQMTKLLPSWGYSGLTYYLQKLSHDLFGIVNHSNDSSAVYIFNERIGLKN